MRRADFFKVRYYFSRSCGKTEGEIVKSDRDAAELYAKDIMGSWRTKDDFLAGKAHERTLHPTNDEVLNLIAMACRQAKEKERQRAKVLLDSIEQYLEISDEIYAPLVNDSAAAMDFREAIKAYQSQTDGESVE